ncbi:MAG: undecaprenyl-diphosphate phosphatase [Pseudonocardiales bacterium]|nr:undecaprenyl-diphosphate phosphatase [Pseudonocardiales bacterium]
MNLGQAIVYGIVQGLTEFLPISSSGHLRIVPALFGWDDPGAAFTAVIQLGTMLAVLLYFWRELFHVTVGWFRGIMELLFNRSDKSDQSSRRTLEYRMGWYIILATIPVGVFGLIFKDQVETGARNLWLIASALIVLAVVLAAAEKYSKRERDEEELNRNDAIAVGFAQALALIPGVSRSGATITAGLFRGLDRPTAARFSFLLSVPAVVLSGLFEARKIGSDNCPTGKHVAADCVAAPGLGITGVATIVSFAVGLASIAWLMQYISKHSTMVFVYYRIALGILLFGLLAGGVISAT